MFDYLKTQQSALVPQRSSGGAHISSGGFLYRLWIGLEIACAVGFLSWMFIF